MSIVTLKPAATEVSQGMLDLADRMEEVAKRIRLGEIRSCSMCYVEAGPEMFVSSDWAAMSGRITMVGGLHRLMQVLSDAVDE